MAELQEKIKSHQINRKILIKQDKNILPAGTCLREDFQTYSQESINALLGSPVYYNLTISSRVCQCILVRSVDQNDGQGVNIYKLYQESTRRHLLSAQKQSNNIGCNYIISCSPKPKKNQSYVGKLRGNFRNNQFHVYDAGENPDKKTSKKRKQLAFINYTQPSLFGKKQNLCQIILPRPEQTPQSTLSNKKYNPQEFIPQSSNQNLLQIQHLKQSDKVQGLVNQSSNNAKSIKMLFQNQHNQISFLRAEQNIVIQRQNHQQTLILLKRSQNSYILKIGFPFNLLQGMGYAIAHLQNKVN